MTSASTKSVKAIGIPLLIATVCLIGTACWVLAAGDKLPGKPKLADKPVSPDSVLEFTALYSEHCAACHGADGKLGPAPPLNDPLFRAIVPQEVLEHVITEGRPGTPMPVFGRAHGGTLTAAQIQVLANQIKGVAYKIVEPAADGPAEFKVVDDSGGIAPVWGAVEPAPSGAPPYASSNHKPSQTVKDFEASRTTLFARACVDCHGDRGEGSESAGAINNREFLALASDQLLRRIIITGLPALGMPDYKSADQRETEFKPLSSADVDELVALLGQWRLGKSSDVK